MLFIALSWSSSYARCDCVCSVLMCSAPRVRLQGGLDVAAIERLKDDDAISLLFKQLSQDYPQVGAWEAGRQGGRGTGFGLLPNANLSHRCAPP